jgi:hypothetical protein
MDGVTLLDSTDILVKFKFLESESSASFSGSSVSEAYNLSLFSNMNHIPLHCSQRLSLKNISRQHPPSTVLESLATSLSPAVPESSNPFLPPPQYASQSAQSQPGYKNGLFDYSLVRSFLSGKKKGHTVDQSDYLHPER